VDNPTRILRGPLQNSLKNSTPFCRTDLLAVGELSRVHGAAQLAVSYRDRVEFNVNPTGRAAGPPHSRVSEVVIPSGSYQCGSTVLKRQRPRSALVHAVDMVVRRLLHAADQVIWTGAWNPTALLTVEFSGERDIGRLATGEFTQTLVGNRSAHHLSPRPVHRELREYDTEEQSIGTNSRLRWTFRPVAISSSSTTTTCARFSIDGSRFEPVLVKVQYALRYMRIGWGVRRGRSDL